MAAIPEISPADAQRRLGELQPVDVRADFEFRGPLGHIAGARLAPLPELDAQAGALPTGRPLLLVCRSGVRSAKACERLTTLGIGPVLNLTGGMIAWNRAGLPVEYDAPASRAELLASAVAWMAQVSALAPDAARERLRAELGEPAVVFEQPTGADVERALARIESSLRESGAPPDLEPSLASFRRWLAAL